MPTPECKVEEPVYHVPDVSGKISSTSSWMSADSPLPGSPVHSLSHGHSLSHSNVYGRSSTSDRWASPGTENLLSSMSVRQEMPWTPTLHSSHPSIARRRESGHLSPVDSWSNMNGSTGRWVGSHDASANHTSPYLEPRARIRASGHPYEEATTIRRDPENMSPTYSHRFPGHCPGGRDSSNHRGLNWHQRDVENFKDSRTHANHHTDTSFTPSPTLPFSNSGYHQAHHQHTPHTSNHSYSSSWSSTDTSVMEAPAALQSLSPQTNISYDTASYGTSSTTMSGSTEYASVDEI
jgi:hypothetical protein